MFSLQYLFGLPFLNRSSAEETKRYTNTMCKRAFVSAQEWSVDTVCMCPWTINLWNHPASIWSSAEAIAWGRGKIGFVSVCVYFSVCVCVSMCGQKMAFCTADVITWGIRERGGKEGAVQLQFPPLPQSHSLPSNSFQRQLPIGPQPGLLV